MKNKLDTFALVKEHSPSLLAQLVDDYDKAKEQFKRQFLSDCQERILICVPTLTPQQAKALAKECLPE